MSPPRRDCARSFAARSASLTAPVIMSARSSGSSGSIAAGSISILSIMPAPFAVTFTAPPPADASTVSVASSSCTRAISACICCTCCIILLMSIPPGMLIRA